MGKQQHKIQLLFFNDRDEQSEVLDAINKKQGIHADCVLKPVNKVLRMIRRIHLKNTSIGIGIWLLPWKNRVRELDLLICIASHYSPQILKWAKKKNPSLRCINYYWDSVDIAGYPIKRWKTYENWSFSREDCTKYQFSYNPQFYIKEITLLDKPGSAEYDLSYVGSDRNGTLNDRNRIVKELYKIGQMKGLVSYIYYVSKDNALPDSVRHDSAMPESEFFKVCGKSRAIVELVENNEKWMTQRSLLAMSNRKKLITNNDRIKKERFYTPDNVFIWGEDSLDQLNEFLEHEFNTGYDEAISYFEFDRWIERFL